MSREALSDVDQSGEIADVDRPFDGLDRLGTETRPLHPDGVRPPHSAGVPVRLDERGHVVGDDRPHPDHDQGTDRASLVDHRVQPEVGSVTDSDMPAQRHVGGRRHVVAEVTATSCPRWSCSPAITAPGPTTVPAPSWTLAPTTAKGWMLGLLMPRNTSVGDGGAQAQLGQFLAVATSA